MEAVVRRGLLKLNVELGNLNVYLENLIFHPIGSGVLNVVLQIFSALHCTCEKKLLCNFNDYMTFRPMQFQPM